MKNTYHLLFVCLLMSTIGALNAQQDAQWSHFQFNHQYYNPGYVGLEHISRATMLNRNQWTGYETTVVEDRDGGAPSQQEIALMHPLRIKSKVVNSGVGLVFNNDKLGPWKKQDLRLDYSYHYKPRLGGTIGIGARVGFQVQSINGSILRATDDNDAIVDYFANNQIRQTKPDVGFGLFYNSTKFYVSASLSHLIRSSYDYKSTFAIKPNSFVSRNLWLGGGYNVIFTRFVITPSVHYKSDFNHSSYNAGVLAQISDYKYWVGFNFRQSFDQKSVNDGNGRQIISDDMVFLVGMSFLKDNALRVGYAFDLVTSGTSAKAPTSHEIMLSYAIPLLLPQKKNPIKDPRYRHE